MRNSYAEPTTPLRLADYRDACSTTACSACGAAAGTPCHLNYVERHDRTTIHLARFTAWVAQHGPRTTLPR